MQIFLTKTVSWMCFVEERMFLTTHIDDIFFVHETMTRLRKQDRDRIPVFGQVNMAKNTKPHTSTVALIA
jgi:hypothetical protein